MARPVSTGILQRLASFCDEYSSAAFKKYKLLIWQGVKIQGFASELSMLEINPIKVALQNLQERTDVLRGYL